ncbi:hypothetical protein DGG96_14575 [Legionella qingyii]|uniref:Uncharacterized protein n=1 Tax=Legionella qingyii TaxID=2184757 RepID=A0A317U2E3_9GAMM|nr:hypothetical protein DGG96_14575 [Legionella qingyii]
MCTLAKEVASDSSTGQHIVFIVIFIINSMVSGKPNGQRVGIIFHRDRLSDFIQKVAVVAISRHVDSCITTVIVLLYFVKRTIVLFKVTGQSQVFLGIGFIASKD